MRDFDPENQRLILDGFLPHLRQQGFDIGVDDYLRVQQLLAQPGFLCHPSELKMLLGPLFAVSEKQQQRFYESFDLYFAMAFKPSETLLPFLTGDSDRSTEQPVNPSSGWKRFAYALATAVAVLLVCLAVWQRSRPDEIVEKNDPPPAVSPLPPETPTPEATQTVVPIGQAIPANWIELKREPIPNYKYQEVWWSRYWWWLVTAAAALPLLAVGAWWLWRKRKQRRLDKQHNDKHPPFTWPLSVPKTTQRLHEVEPFNATTRLLRRRQLGEGVRFDIAATIKATVARSGLPELRYSPTSKVPEYLLLIDRVALPDHQAQYFDEFAAQLASQDVFVERYFYDGDPRVCYRDDYRTGTLLEDLPRRGHRLLVYGNGARFIEAASGEIKSWAEWFADWDDRALLTAVPPTQWGVRERKLAELFVVSPATLEGLRETITHFELQSQPDLRVTRRHSTEPALPNFSFDGVPEETAERLRAYLDHEPLFQWVCACAVYPELQWNLTLCLGELVMPQGQLWERDVLRLARLPWFRQGVMPDELRYALLRRLTPENQNQVSRKLAALLRQTETELLQNIPAFEHSWARESLRLQVDLQQWLAHRDDERAEALRQRLREMPAGLVTRDYATLREVEAEPLTKLEQKLNDLLPAELRKSVYQSGIPLFGLKSSALAALAAPLALLIALSLAPFKPPADGSIETVPLEPEYERVTAMIPSVTPTPTVTPLPGITPAPSVTPTSEVAYGGLRINFDLSKVLLAPSITEFSLTYKDGRKQIPLRLISVREPYLWKNLAVGRYVLISPNPDVDILSNCNNREVQVVSGKLTEVECQFSIGKASTNATTCFAPVATISIPRTVTVGEEVSISGNVEGGKNYGELSFEWTSSANWTFSAGKVIQSGVSRASKPLYRFDATGVAPGTSTEIKVNITSSQGNCKAFGFTLITVVVAPAPPAMTTALSMPELKGQDLTTARRRLLALEPKLQITAQPVNDGQAKPEEVVRQDPPAGEPLRPGQQVTLYVAQAPATATPSANTSKIKTAQDYLIALGMYPAGQADGMMGPRMRAALNEFQKQQGLPISNEIDDIVLAKLGEQVAKQGNQSKQGKCTPFVVEVAVVSSTDTQRVSLSGERTCGSDNTPTYTLLYLLSDRVGKDFQDKFRAKFTVDERQRAQVETLLSEGLNAEQAKFLAGPITKLAQTYSADTKPVNSEVAAMFQRLLEMSKPNKTAK